MDSAKFDKCVQWLRSDDSSIYENGYHSILGHVDEVLDKLLKLASNENDGFMKGIFVELIGESINPKAIAFLNEELRSPHREVREWAYSSLINSECKTANLSAKQFAKENPKEEYL